MPKDKVIRTPVTDHWGEQTSWAVEANFYFNNGHANSIPEAVDQTIMRYMTEHGDLRPLIDLFLAGKNPGPAVLIEFARMFEGCDSEGEEALPAFRFEVTGTKQHPKKDGEIDFKNFIVGITVENLKANRGDYEAAVRDAALKCSVSKSEARRCYDQRKENRFYQIMNQAGGIG